MRRHLSTKKQVIRLQIINFWSNRFLIEDLPLTCIIHLYTHIPHIICYIKYMAFRIRVKIILLIFLNPPRFTSILILNDSFNYWSLIYTYTHTSRYMIRIHRTHTREIFPGSRDVEFWIFYINTLEGPTPRNIAALRTKEDRSETTDILQYDTHTHAYACAKLNAQS